MNDDNKMDRNADKVLSLTTELMEKEKTIEMMKTIIEINDEELLIIYEKRIFLMLMLGDICLQKNK